MKVSRNWLQTYFDKIIPAAPKLAELFTFHSFEVEGIEDLSNDAVLDVKILPDRAHYCLSHDGIATEISLLTDQSKKENRIPQSPEIEIENKININIENKLFCRRYIGRFVEINVPKGSEMICDMLNAVGQRSINPIVDATNMVMLDIGQPLHAFDADKVKGDIRVRLAKDKEKIMLLDGREITLSIDDNVIADDEGALAIAGVKGGKRAQISSETKKIIIESANFEPTAIRRTSTKYDLRSDSSKRYENEITPELAIRGMNDISALIKQMSPKSKFGPIIDEYPLKAVKKIVDFNPSYIENRLGISVPMDKIRNILIRMNIAVEDNGEKWKLTIPFERLDLNIKEDIVEEVGRIYGYDHITGILPPKTEKNTAILSSYYISEKIKNILIDAGYSEVSLYSLVSKGDIETLKPLALDKAYARKNLSQGIIECAFRNALNADLLGLDQIKIFEIGHVFSDIGERLMLGIGTVQIKKIKGLSSISIIKDAHKLLEEKLGINLDDDINEQKFLNINVAVSEIDIGEISKSLKNIDSYMDLNFGQASLNHYKKFSQYPFIVRDIAVYVPESIQADDVWKMINNSIDEAKASELLVRHTLFDIFKKDGKISFAFRMVFQSMERTLTDNEVNSLMASINIRLKENGWEVR